MLGDFLWEVLVVQLAALLDGIYDETSVGGKVYSASIGADGMLSPFQSIGALPVTSDVYSSTAWIDGPAGSQPATARHAAILAFQRHFAPARLDGRVDADLTALLF